MNMTTSTLLNSTISTIAMITATLLSTTIKKRRMMTSHSMQMAHPMMMMMDDGHL
ncbi:hypothetical protein BGZ59_003193, partial [Podila verticillata]